MISYRPATPADAEAIARIFAQSFTDTFAHLYPPQDLAAFLGRFTLDAWRAELDDPDIALRIAEAEGEPVGFAKVSAPTLPYETDVPTVELRQLYVLKPWLGAGIAPVLMDWVLAEARRRGARQVILTVYVDNSRARRFYERYGFEEVGRYAFMVGETADDDRIMRLKL
jgi:diamine N-acetyltransferase